MIDLKPCPSCGIVPEPQYYEYPDRGPDEADGYYYVQCERPCTNEHSSHDLEELVREWNTRPIEDALRAELTAARASISKLEAVRDGASRLVYIINRAGINNLADGVQLGQMSWLMKAKDALSYTEEALARLKEVEGNPNE